LTELFKTHNNDEVYRQLCTDVIKKIMIICVKINVNKSVVKLCYAVLFIIGFVILISAKQ